MPKAAEPRWRAAFVGRTSAMNIEKLSPARLFDLAGMTCDPWQRDVLTSDARRILLNCSRQAGKSTVAAALALYEILINPLALVVVLARAERQAVELFHKVL